MYDYSIIKTLSSGEKINILKCIIDPNFLDTTNNREAAIAAHIRLDRIYNPGFLPKELAPKDGELSLEEWAIKLEKTSFARAV